MNSIERWKDVGDKLDFNVSFWTGGGIGDCVHHYKNLAYFRILRHLKEVFPNLKVTLQIVGDNSELIKTLFELDPYIDEIVTAPQNGFLFRDVYDFMQGECDLRKDEYARLHPCADDPEVVFRRTVNRVYALLRFPRQRTITMDDFFQQLRLNVDDFKWECAEIFLSDDDKIFGERVRGIIPDKLVGIHWFSKDETRTCLSGQQWYEIVRGLVERNYSVVVFGAPHEIDLSSGKLPQHEKTEELVQLWSKIKFEASVFGLFKETLRRKLAVLKQCDYVVCIDGSIMHLAWLHAVPTLTVVEKPKSGSHYFDEVHGYHWAAAAGEPFAKRIISNHGETRLLKSDAIIDEMEKLEGTKGRRVSNIWKDQGETLQQ